ncbi:DNA-directed RNA polymerase II subunit [Blyttiomyces sp. JEL0837]|nr:DNA-directed RNA polymerase II subunit [Blyttiomyces sp. JEL0837]
MVYKQLTHVIQLHPQYFGPRMREYLVKRLHEEVEGTCSGRFGYVISVVEVVEVGHGVLQTASGFAEFNITYKAIVFKPFKNQVVDGVVTTVNRMGFFADVGPLQVFVSAHLLQAGMQWDANANPPAYVGTLQASLDLRIEKGESVRIRIIGTRVDANEIFAIGTIREDYLGPGQNV